MTEELSTSLRVDAGRPLFGVDMDTDTIPLEAGLLERAISTTKGCYVGQEVIIRVLHRGGGRVARRLVKIAFHFGASRSGRSAARSSSRSEIVRSAASRAQRRHSRIRGLSRLATSAATSAEIGREVVTDAPQSVGGVITGLPG